MSWTAPSTPGSPASSRSGERLGVTRTSGRPERSSERAAAHTDVERPDFGGPAMTNPGPS
ncbi:hypothetical protein AN220_23685 [Streptomyces nanshensis]|nr:hypothetical protein AN220_23685 [Streptomyces nanshensis]